MLNDRTATEKQNCKLTVSDLSISFGGVKALKGISFTVEPGQFVGLMGPNGAGKTTLINCISKVIDPQAGRVTFGDKDLLKMKAHEIAKMGIARTYQDLEFFNKIQDMMVIDYLKLGQFPLSSGSVFGDGFQTKFARQHEHDMKVSARQVLEFFREMRLLFEADEEERGYPSLFGREGFPDLIDVEYGPIGALSFAWRRRLDLARVLVSKPKFLLLDEPAQGLPPSEVKNLGRILKHIQKEFGVGALIVEHNVATLFEISDYIVVLDNGEKIAEGSAQEVNKNPKVIEVYLGKGNEQSKTRPTENVDKDGNPKKRIGRPLLQVKEIDLFYFQAQALFSVSLEVYPHEVVCLLGTNGSGKSTTLKAIGGTEKPSIGNILFEGKDVPLGWPEVVAERKIRYVPQGHITFPNLTVLENLRLGGFTEEKSGNSLNSGYEKVFHYFPQLSTLREALANSLSGGQQQMLAIGQALMSSPKLLLVDEPSLGLAPVFVDLIFSIIRKISEEENCSVLLVEQNVAKALEVSDYVYMMSSGAVVGHGNVSQFRKEDAIIKKNLGFS